MLTEFSAHFLVKFTSIALIEEATELAAANVEPVRALTRLRASAPPEVAAAAWDLALLRHRAVAKLGPVAARMFFDRDGYEMASSENCSAYHATLLRESGAQFIFDPCAGVGVDACRIAREGIRVVACEMDPARAVFARANAEALGVSDLVEVIEGDATTLPLPVGADHAFFDPARRDQSRKRLVGGNDLIPPLRFIERLRDAGIHSVLAKLSPAIDREIGRDYGGDVEFISDAGECKEALLRTGSLATGSAVSARLLPAGNRLCAPAPSVRVQEEVRGYVYEPDPAVIRAGLTGHVAAAVEGWQIDSHVDYVFSEQFISTPLADVYKIECAFPYHLKRLRQELMERGVGRVIVKKRAFPEEPDDVRKRLKLEGSEERIVILTRSGQRLWAMIGRRATF